MSNWVRPTVAAKNAVVAPMNATTASALGAYSNKGDSRLTMNTPAVTMVAAWIRADTGVGPSIASGSQVCSGIWADLPMAPTNSSSARQVSEFTCMPRKLNVCSVMPGAAANTVSNETLLNTRNTPRMPSENPKSPTRLTTNALIAAALADGRSYQNPIR